MFSVISRFISKLPKPSNILFGTPVGLKEPEIREEDNTRLF